MYIRYIFLFVCLFVLCQYVNCVLVSIYIFLLLIGNLYMELSHGIFTKKKKKKKNEKKTGIVTAGHLVFSVGL